MAEWSGDLNAELHALIDRRKSPDRPLVVGITGVDTAGKSQLAEVLSTRLQAGRRHVQLIHVDDFHRPHAERHHPELTQPQQFYQLSIDFPRLRRELLEPIRHQGGVSTRLRLLDHYSDTWSIHRTYHVDAATVVLLEGIFLLRPEIREFIDVMVFLHVDEATVLARATARDVPRQGIEVMARYHRKYLPGQREYLAANRPRDHADIIVDNRDYRAPRVLKWPEPTPVRDLDDAG